MPRLLDIVEAQKKVGLPICQEQFIDRGVPGLDEGEVAVCGLVCQVLAIGNYDVADIIRLDEVGAIPLVVELELGLSQRDIKMYCGYFDVNFESDKPTFGTPIEWQGYEDAKALGLLINDICPRCGEVTGDQGELCSVCQEMDHYDE